MKLETLKDAIAFIYSPDNMQQVAFGSMDIKLSNGEVLNVPATMRSKCREALFGDYSNARRHPQGKRWFGKANEEGSFKYNGVGRTKFLAAAELSAKGDLKQLGALDVVSEQCGRMQFANLREIVRELATISPSACGSMADAALARIDAVEIHIKRDLKAHLRHADASDCAWHCPNHAHADADSHDASRAAACTHEHSTGCVECAQLAALGQDMQHMLAAAETSLRGALPPLPPQAPSNAPMAVGSFVTFTDESDVAHATVVRTIIAPAAPAAPTAGTAPTATGTADVAAGTRYLVDVGFEGALRVAPAAALARRASELRLETLAQLRELVRRSSEKLETYYHHMLRAAHEAATMSRLLDGLEDDEVVLVADWKMKFLMSVFREAMAEYFGKRGMPWHGCMLVRKPLRFERARYGEGEFVCEYKHAMMLTSKEDGFATLAAVHVALSEYKIENPHIANAFVKTDGAAAYAGATFTLGLSFMDETTGIRVERHFIGESGQNKSTLDGEFASYGGMLRRLICSGAHDVRTPDDLFNGLKKVLKGRGGRSAALFMPGGVDADFEHATVERLTLMSDRAYAYDAGGNFAALLLRRQSFLGAGERIECAALFPKGRVAPAAPLVVATTSAGAAGSSLGDKLVARSDAGRAAHAKAKAERKLSVLEKLERARRAIVEDARKQRADARAYRMFRCCEQEGGTPGCDRLFERFTEFRKHVQRGRADPRVHRSGFDRPYAAGAVVGGECADDVMRRAIAAQAGTITRHGGEGGTAVPTLVPIDELRCQLCDGEDCAPQPPEAGFAGNTQRRAKTRSKSALQLEYCVLVGHLIKENGYDNLHGHEAAQQMLAWGTPAFATRFRRVHEAGASADGRSYLPRTAQLAASELTPLLMEKKTALEVRVAKLRERELRPPPKKKGGGRKRTAGAAGGGGGVGGGGGGGGGGSKRPKASAEATLRSARRKLARAGWDVAAAVGGKGGKRADKVTVPELKALVADRGWKLAAGKSVNQCNLLALAVSHARFARMTAAAAANREDDPDSDDGLLEAWGWHASDLADESTNEDTHDDHQQRADAVEAASDEADAADGQEAAGTHMEIDDDAHGDEREESEEAEEAEDEADDEADDAVDDAADDQIGDAEGSDFDDDFDMQWSGADSDASVASDAEDGGDGVQPQAAPASSSSSDDDDE